MRERWLRRQTGARVGVGLCLVLGALGCSPARPAADESLAASASPVATPGPSSAASSAAATAAPRSVPPSALQSIELPGGPNVIAISANRVWVELHRASSLASIDPITLAPTQYPDVDVHCGIASDGMNAVWATHFDKNQLARVDATTGSATLTVTIPGACGLGVSDSQVWATSPSTARVFRIDPSSGSTIIDVAVPGMPFGAAPLGDAVYASGEGGGGWLAVLDSEDGRTLSISSAPDIVLPDGLALGFGSLWTAGRLDPRLLRLDPESLAVEAEIEIGGTPSGLAVTSDAVWVSRLDGQLIRIDPETGDISDRWSLPYSFLAWPTLGFDRLWMTSLEDNAVISIDLTQLAP
jgi:hypothetical protein